MQGAANVVCCVRSQRRALDVGRTIVLDGPAAVLGMPVLQRKTGHGESRSLQDVEDPIDVVAVNLRLAGALSGDREPSGSGDHVEIPC
jgi:hypothetical protein